jgi:cell division protein FtsN
MVFLVMLLIAVAVVVLVMRAASTQNGAATKAPRAPKPPRNREQARPLAPDDDPDFIRELERRTRRDDGSPA